MRVTPSVLAIALASGVTATVSAQTPIPVDRTGYQIFDATQISVTATALSGWAAGSRAASTFYSSLGTDGSFGFSSTAVGPSALIDDYSGDGSASNGLVELEEVTFVGGVDNAGDIIFFDFFSTGGALVGGFGMSLATVNPF